AEEAFAEEGLEEIGEADEAGVPFSSEVKDEAIDDESQSEEKEAAGGGSDAFVTDRGTDGQPLPPKKVDVPRIAAGSGSDAFVTDRDKDAKPEAAKKVNIPQAQGESELNKASSKAARA